MSMRIRSRIDEEGILDRLTQYIMVELDEIKADCVGVLQEIFDENI